MSLSAFIRDGLRLVYQTTCQFPQKSMSIFGWMWNLDNSEKGTYIKGYRIIVLSPLQGRRRVDP
ncbi:MAG: hypothetical protein A2235_06135 [Deltaproteobacteria bacterium RIFOXYA2_FULL_42_10]|nr:MAG: hypothetical protein A3H47_03380 [Deltaproteobacteria bacterium RIFCSPLOWO2_02_FULL_42_39]OGQ72871.1 MAG: hypothetical protein A2235_06135 [Deltaproteobacteria bacterium RIFOXYA2_FULL_42_10]